MGVSKRHHVLPISYLKGWSNGTTHILSRDLQAAGRERPVSVKDAAVSKNRNRDVLMEHHGLHATHLEDSVLQHLDGAVSTLLRKLRTAYSNHLDDGESLLIKEFIAHQMTRSDFQLERTEASILDRHKDGLLSGLESGSEIGPLQEVISSSRGLIDETHVSRHFAFSALMNDVDEHFRNLLPRTIRLYRTESPLVTCDEPVVPIFESMKRGRQDLCCAPIVVFPVSSHRVLMLFHPEMPMRVEDGDLLTSGEVEDLNRVIAGNATRFIFGSPDFEGLGSIDVPESALELYDRVYGDDRYNDDPEGDRTDLLIGDLGRWEFSESAPVRPIGRLWPVWSVQTSDVSRYITKHFWPRYSMLKSRRVLERAS